MTDYDLDDLAFEAAFPEVHAQAAALCLEATYCGVHGPGNNEFNRLNNRARDLLEEARDAWNLKKAGG